MKNSRIRIAISSLIVVALGSFGFVMIRLAIDMVQNYKFERKMKLSLAAPRVIPEDFNIPWLEPYSSSKETVATVDDLRTLEYERREELWRKFPDPMEYGKNFKSISYRLRPLPETRILIEALERACAAENIDTKLLGNIADAMRLGVHSEALFPALIRGLERLENMHGELALTAKYDLIPALGRIYSRSSAETLMRIIPQDTNSMDIFSNYLLASGALRGLASLPPELSIPCLERVYYEWFGEGAPEVEMVEIENRSMLEKTYVT